MELGYTKPDEGWLGDQRNRVFGVKRDLGDYREFATGGIVSGDVTMIQARGNGKSRLMELRDDAHRIQRYSDIAKYTGRPLMMPDPKKYPSPTHIRVQFDRDDE